MHLNATLFFPILLLILNLTACTKPAPLPSQPHAPQESPKTQSPSQLPSSGESQVIPAPQSAQPAMDNEEPQAQCVECEAVDPKQDRNGCFALQPGKVTKNKQKKTVTGRCQPQCIPYARCRSGIMTCRLGDTGSVEWFECARKNKATTSIPKAGSIMVLDANKRRKMSTGHLGYVEEACPNPDGTWTLRFSHTNYDRKCHLDLDAKVLFNPKTMTATFLSGAWKAWAKDLKIRGFILR